MSKLVSIIVPVYNVEKYIEESINSIINQTYKNLEIIIIDDGSTDKSNKICKQFANKDARIKVIDKSNGGSASAKNIGLQIARGDYISFVDSDDYIETDMIDYMVKKIEKNDVDIVQCGFCNLYINGKVVSGKDLDSKIYSNEEFLMSLLYDWRNNLFWNKLFKKEILENLYFYEGRCIDDEFFTYKAILKSKSILLDNKQVYNYRMRLSGVMKSNESKYQILKDRIDYLIERYGIISKSMINIKSSFLDHMLNNLLIISRNIYTDEKLIKYIKKSMNPFLKDVLFTNKNLIINMHILKFMVTPSYILAKKNKKIEKNIIEDIKNYFE